MPDGNGNPNPNPNSYQIVEQHMQEANQGKPIGPPGPNGQPMILNVASPKSGENFNMYNVNSQAYKNPVGDQSGNWNSGMQNFLGATTGAAPQMGQTQIGPTATYGGAQMQANQYNQSYGQEAALANRLGAMSMGQGPSMAQVQAQQGAQQNLSNQMAAMGGQRGGGNPALAAYQAQNLGAQAQQAAAQQAVAGRTQEEMSAMGQQAGVLGAMNQQAQGFAGNQAQLTQQAQLASMGAINQQNTAQAGLYQQANQANLGANMSQEQMNAQQYNNYMSILSQQNQNQFQANMAEQAQNSSNYNTAAGTAAGLSIAQAQADAQLGGAVAGGGGALAAGLLSAYGSSTSDRKSKKNIRTGEKELSKMLRNMYDSPQFKKMLLVI